MVLKEPDDQLQNEIQDALENDSLPSYYINGFITTLSVGDILILMKHNNKVIAKINTSYTVAKTLAQKLGQAIAQLETTSGNEIMTTDDITKLFGEKKD